MVSTHTARRAWRRLEPVHGMIYFVPEAVEQFAALGVTDRQMGYFASRGAAFGRVSAEVVIATFFNFCPGLVRRALPAAWDIVTPQRLLDARLRAAGNALKRAGLDQHPDLPETLALARRAAEAALGHLEGRPLFAAHATLPWPEEPHLTLWHAQTLLREFRGDGHIAALTVEGLNGREALVLHAASGDVPAIFLKASRGWSAEEWDATEEDLRGRGLLGEGLTLTGEGEALRRRIEDRTDALALPAYAALGEEDCARLAELARSFGRTVVDSGLLSFA
ncbi:hypothetical protein AB0O34_14095 [Sphaerisporangium sp. NPDC088356]|uniref:SCO6745 family protein n=1 Tax=Sphaerisporangium sp. NPDC088356 TaxID=3154871 RepID=UPI00342B73E4